MNYRELQERCKNRNFDRIVVVTDDIFRELANMQKIEHVTPGEIQIRTGRTRPLSAGNKGELAYTEHTAAFFYENTALQFVQPGEGDTIYRRYLERFGRGICCVRERISADSWQETLDGYEKKGLKAAQSADTPACHAVWFDLMDSLGIIFEVIRDDSGRARPSHTESARICQINITTKDVRRTIAALADLLEIGPWEVGCQSNRCVTDAAFRVDGRLTTPEFAFLLAILVCGNLEWEVIEPVKGPLVYNAFLAERGIGFHHILQEYPAEKWQDTIRDYEENGIELSCRGKLGPVEWCYMDTSAGLGFYKEMRTDAVMEQLPEGYLQFYYPQQVSCT